jgi:hypothetical protein
MADNYLNVTPVLYRQVLNFLKDGRKINAIKALREGIADTNAQVGLKEAKQAVEKLAHDKAIPDIRSADHPDAMTIVSGPRIIKVVLDYGDGPVELDLEGMQIKALSEMHAIGLDACADMLEMVDVFKAISVGEKVQVVKAAEDS